LYIHLHILCIGHVAAELVHMTDRHQFEHFELFWQSWII
jgi:hypothetical protein